jgi:hypothetical protein
VRHSPCRDLASLLPSPSLYHGGELAFLYFRLFGSTLLTKALALANLYMSHPGV